MSGGMSRSPSGSIDIKLTAEQLADWKRLLKDAPICPDMTRSIAADRIDWTGSSMPKAWRRRYAITDTVCTVIGVFIGMGLWQLLH